MKKIFTVCLCFCVLITSFQVVFAEQSSLLHSDSLSPLALNKVSSRSTLKIPFSRNVAAAIIMLIFNVLPQDSFAQQNFVIDDSAIPKKVKRIWKHQKESVFNFIEYINSNFFSVKPVEFHLDKNLQPRVGMTFVQRLKEEKNLIRLNANEFTDIIRNNEFFSLTTHELAHGGDLFTNDLSNIILSSKEKITGLRYFNLALMHHREGLAEGRRAFWHYYTYGNYYEFQAIEAYEKNLHSQFGYILTSVFGQDYKYAVEVYEEKPSSVYDLWHSKLGKHSDFFYYSRYTQDNTRVNYHRLIAFLGQLQESGFYLGRQMFNPNKKEFYSPFHLSFFKKYFFESEKSDKLLGVMESNGTIVSANDGLIGVIKSDSMAVYLPIHHMGHPEHKPISIIQYKETNKLNRKEMVKYFVNILYDYQLPEEYQKKVFNFRLGWAVFSLKTLATLAEKKGLISEAQSYRNKQKNLEQLGELSKQDGVNIEELELKMNRMGIPVWMTFILLQLVISEMMIRRNDRYESRKRRGSKFLSLNNPGLVSIFLKFA